MAPLRTCSEGRRNVKPIETLMRKNIWQMLLTFLHSRKHSPGFLRFAISPTHSSSTPSFMLLYSPATIWPGTSSYAAAERCRSFSRRLSLNTNKGSLRSFIILSHLWSTSPLTCGPHQNRRRHTKQSWSIFYHTQLPFRQPHPFVKQKKKRTTKNGQ